MTHQLLMARALISTVRPLSGVPHVHDITVSGRAAVLVLEELERLEVLVRELQTRLDVAA